MRIIAPRPATGPAREGGFCRTRAPGLVRGPALVRGFTLLELMVTVTVGAIILGLGIPNLTQFIRNSRMTSSANDVLAGIHMARTEAVKRRAWTVMCQSTDPTAATPTCTAGGRGWIVFVDDADPAASSANDGNLVVNPGEPVLLRHDALDTTLTLRSTPNGNRGYIAFTASGFARAVAAGTALTNLVVCDSRGNVSVDGADTSAARAVSISADRSPTGNPAARRNHCAGWLLIKMKILHLHSIGIGWVASRSSKHLLHSLCFPSACWASLACM